MANEFKYDESTRTRNGLFGRKITVKKESYGGGITEGIGKVSNKRKTRTVTNAKGDTKKREVLRTNVDGLDGKKTNFKTVTKTKTQKFAGKTGTGVLTKEKAKGVMRKTGEKTVRNKVGQKTFSYTPNKGQPSLMERRRKMSELNINKGKIKAARPQTGEIKFR